MALRSQDEPLLDALLENNTAQDVVNAALAMEQKRAQAADVAAMPNVWPTAAIVPDGDWPGFVEWLENGAGASEWESAWVDVRVELETLVPLRSAAAALAAMKLWKALDRAFPHLRSIAYQVPR